MVLLLLIELLCVRISVRMKVPEWAKLSLGYELALLIFHQLLSAARWSINCAIGTSSLRFYIGITLLFALLLSFVDIFEIPVIILIIVFIELGFLEYLGLHNIDALVLLPPLGCSLPCLQLPQLLLQHIHVLFLKALFPLLSLISTPWLRNRGEYLLL